MSKKPKMCAYNTKRQKLKVEVNKQNFVFKATKIWNKLIEINKSVTSDGLIIPGSARISDLNASIY